MDQAQAAQQEACLFCKIIRGEIPSYKVYEDEVAYAFLDINPFGRGHTLVVPKVHAQDLLHLPAEVLARMMPSVQRVAALLKERLHCEGLALLQLTGEAAGQTVFHLHFHLIPRYAGQGSEWAPLEGAQKAAATDFPAILAELGVAQPR